MGRLAEVKVRFRDRFAYIDGELHTGEVLPLCRLRYTNSASLWGFAIHLAVGTGKRIRVLPNGLPVGIPEGALDCACGLYLNIPTPGRSTSRQPVPDHARTTIRKYYVESSHPLDGWR
jgi:hypothetical protein